MTDSMKFGPEWLRNMGQDGCAAPASAPRYQLAEHRYGREEMLALFDSLVRAPDPLASFPGLYVDKTQVPLALIQMTEEETRQWHRGINSDAVLRVTGKAPSPSVPPSLRGTGRGGSLGSTSLSDRGRGRGRGGFTYSRGLSYEESNESPSGPPHGHLGPPPGGYTRGGRSFDRSQVERNWGERNGLDSGDWNSTSPRKDFSDRDRVMSGQRSYSTTESNWRRHRATEDEDGWRTSGAPAKEKWGGAVTGGGGAPRTTSWRDGDRDRERDGDRELDGRGTYTRSHRSWDHSNLPEWAVDGADNSGGSFDAQGAFHGGHTYSDDDEAGGHVGNRRTRLLSEGNSGNASHRKTGHVDGGPSANSALRRNFATDRASCERVSDMLTPYVDKQIDTRVPSPPSPPQEEEAKTNNTMPPSPVHSSQSDPDLKSQNSTPEKKMLKADTHAVLQQSQSPHPLVTSASMPAISVPSSIPQENHLDSRQTHPLQAQHKSEEAMDHMREVADDLVTKLIEDEEGPLRGGPSHIPAHPAHLQEPEKWYYRDPQGHVQGPFSSEEMAEWFRLGYFNLNLLVRRAKDERFSPLQDLISVFGGIPFLTETNVPPIKGSEPGLCQTPVAPSPAVRVPMGPAIPKIMSGIPNVPGVTGVANLPNVEPEIQMMMQHQYLLQQQMFLRQQSQAAAAAAVLNKLSQTEGWNALSPIEQQQLLAQQIQMNAHMSQIETVPPMIPASTPTAPVMALLSQYQHKQQPPPQPRLQQGTENSGQSGSLEQLIQQMGGLSGRLSPPPKQQQQLPGGDQLPSNPIQSLLRQLGQQQQQQSAHHQQSTDSLWGGTHPVYPPAGWLGSVCPPVVGGGVPPGGSLLPPAAAASLWGDLPSKEMKTEEQILEEQMKAEEERKQQEQIRKQEEDQKRRVEEEARQKREAEEAAVIAAAAVEKQRLKDELKRKEEEAKRKEEQRKAEEERKRQEEIKRQETAKRKEEEKKKKEEEKRRKEEEKERRRRDEEERKRQEEERVQQAREAEEQAKKAEVAHQQQIEALRKLQEQQQKQAAVKTAKVAPWSQPKATSPLAQPVSLSLAEIQRNQKREKEEQMREQQMIMQQIQQQNQQNQLSAMLASSLAAAESQGTQMQLKWADCKPAPPPEPKTLEQIQREEQELIAKQLERDRAERAERASTRDVPNPSVGIWGAAPQSLTWGNSNSGSGFWDDIASPAPTTVKPAPVKKGVPMKSASTSNMTATSTVQQPSPKPASSSTKKKKDEASVLKLFEQRTDEFSQWCHKALASLQPSVDIPTFVGFLRDIESPYEVKDYVRVYLGENEGAKDFARQFLERRSKWRSERRSKPAADDMCAPAPAVNPVTQQASHDFQEVKGKGKKTKKGKMYKVDKSILGFSVTAAPDRINVGDRDYGEGL